jgi:FtsZ-binding cell division protein ZapB
MQEKSYQKNIQDNYNTLPQAIQNLYKCNEAVNKKNDEKTNKPNFWQDIRTRILINKNLYEDT